MTPPPLANLLPVPATDTSARPTSPAFGWPFAVAVALAVLFMTATHEFGHWLVYTLLGYDAAMSLNTVSIEGEVSREWHRIAASAAGPFVTYFQAGLAFFFLRRGKADWIFAFLLTPLVYRTLASVANIWTKNDEGRLSEAAGLGAFTLFAVVCSLLLVLVVDISRRREYAFGKVALFCLLAAVCVGVVVLADNLWSLRLL